MTSQPLQHEVDLWETWIDYDQFNNSHFGTLYIIGEILTDQRTAEPIIKKITRKSGERLLVLQLPQQPAHGRGRVKEILYSEPIEQLDQYDAVCVYSGHELIVRFTEIEVMI
jgi:hypothetical protein